MPRCASSTASGVASATAPCYERTRALRSGAERELVLDVVDGDRAGARFGTPDLDEAVRAERRDAHGERRRQAAGATVAGEERGERSFLLVGVRTVDDGGALVEESHFEAHEALPWPLGVDRT